ncbi:hypothetical protein LTR67_000684 [Exophiala xenobiotica]
MSVPILSGREEDIAYVARGLSPWTSPNSSGGSQMFELETSERSDAVLKGEDNTGKQNYERMNATVVLRMTDEGGMCAGVRPLEQSRRVAPR